MIHIVKRAGHKEPFDARKVYGSVFFACRNVHLDEPEAEKIAEQVSKRIEQWVKPKKSVSSQDISQQVAKELDKINADAAFMYETHRDLS